MDRVSARCCAKRPEGSQSRLTSSRSTPLHSKENAASPVPTLLHTQPAPVKSFNCARPARARPFLLSESLTSYLTFRKRGLRGKFFSTVRPQHPWQVALPDLLFFPCRSKPGPPKKVSRFFLGFFHIAPSHKAAPFFSGPLLVRAPRKLPFDELVSQDQRFDHVWLMFYVV